MNKEKNKPVLTEGKTRRTSKGHTSNTRPIGPPPSPGSNDTKKLSTLVYLNLKDVGLTLKFKCNKCATNNTIVVSDYNFDQYEDLDKIYAEISFKCEGCNTDHSIIF